MLPSQGREASSILVPRSMIFKALFLLIIIAALGFVGYRFGVFNEVLQRLAPQIDKIKPLTTPIPLLPTNTPQPIEKISSSSATINILNAPTTASASAAFTISWYIRNDKIATASSTAIRYGKLSKDKVSLASEYPEKSAIYKGPIPATFSAQLTIVLPGIYYYRAHALINDINVWSPEQVIEVKSATTSATPTP